MTPAQLREARRLLGLTHGQLAKLAGVLSHVAPEYERTGRQTRARDGEDRLAKIRVALEGAGVVFSEGGGVTLHQTANT